MHLPRHPIRLASDSYRFGDPFLLTMCAAQHAPVFGPNEVAEEVLAARVEAQSKTLAMVWAGVVMPDHAHIVVSGRAGASVLDHAACFKRLATARLRRLGWTGVVWQRRIHDRGIRRDTNTSVGEVVEYVLNNPVRAGLAADAREWPFSLIWDGDALRRLVEVGREMEESHGWVPPSVHWVVAAGPAPAAEDGTGRLTTVDDPKGGTTHGVLDGERSGHRNAAGTGPAATTHGAVEEPRP